MGKGRDEFEHRVRVRMETTGEDFVTACRSVSRETSRGRPKPPAKPAPVVIYRRTRSNRPPPMGGAT